MLSSWLGGAKNQSKPSVNMTVFDSNAMVKQILTQIEERLEKELGQQIHEQISKINEDIMSSQMLEKSLLDTKEKFNTIITQLDNEHEQTREIFVSNSLHSEDMLIPLKDIEKGMAEYNPQKVQKNLKYLHKLYESALQDILKVKVNSKQEELQDELNLIRNLNKSLEGELSRVRRDKFDLQNRVSDSQTRIAEQNEKIKVLEKLGSEATIQFQYKERQKAKAREGQLSTKIKHLELQNSRLQKKNKQAELQVIRSGSSVEVMRQNQDSVIEELQLELGRKEIKFEQMIKKLYYEKSQTEEKIIVLEEEIEAMKRQKEVKNEETVNVQKKEKQQQIKRLKNKIEDLQSENDILTKKIDGCVSRQMLKNLFTNYDDESKEWSIRRDIKSQIQTLLNIPHSLPGTGENKKWFGLF